MKGKVFGYLEGDGGGRGLGGLKARHDLSQHEAWTAAILPADAAAGQPENPVGRRPLMVFAGVIGVAMAIIGLRLVGLQMVDGDKNLALADGNRTRLDTTRAPRGQITDSRRTVLARNQVSFDVTVIPRALPRDPQERARLYGRAATYLGIPIDAVKSRAEITCKGLEESTGCLTTSVPQLLLPSATRDQALLITQQAAELPGLAVDTNPIRQYKDDGLLSVFLGYTGRVNAEEAAKDRTYGPTDLIGKLGLEKQYESLLRGTNGATRTEVDATGRPIRVLASSEAKPGANVQLSVDMDLQRVLAGAITKQMEASGAKRASGVAVDPRTGAVLAAVSLPSYDSNLFTKPVSVADYNKLNTDPGQPLFNKVVMGTYPSGSVIKPFGAAAALQEGIVTVSTFINDLGQIVVPNKYDPANPAIYKGWERVNGLGRVNVISALSRSSDIWFYKVMGGLFGTDDDFTKPLGIKKLAEYYKKFGFGAKTGIDLPAETAGRVPTPEWKKAFGGEDWYTGDTYNVSVGQGDILVSPLQMVMATSAIANGGTLYQPSFMSRITDDKGKVLQQAKAVVKDKDFISPANINLVRQGMYATINDDNGTACCKLRAEVPVKVAGKTGTAETVVKDSGLDPSQQSRPNAWFEAFAPYDNPKIAIVVLVEHAGEGSQYAAPAARETLSWYFTQGAGASK